MPRWGFTVPLSSMGACRDRAEKDDDPTCTPCARYNKMSAINVLALCGMRLIDRRLGSFADDNTPSWHWMSGIAALFHGSSCHVFSLFHSLSLSLSLSFPLYLSISFSRETTKSRDAEFLESNCLLFHGSFTAATVLVLAFLIRRNDGDVPVRVIIW